MLIAEMGPAETLYQIHIDQPTIESKVQKKVADWRGLVSGSVADGRQLLREVLEAPLRFTPELGFLRRPRTDPPCRLPVSGEEGAVRGAARTLHLAGP